MIGEISNNYNSKIRTNSYYWYMLKKYLMPHSQFNVNAPTNTIINLCCPTENLVLKVL